MKWSELKKLGVKRCCADLTVTYPDGTKKYGVRCRRRVDPDDPEGSWCVKHGPRMRAWTAYNVKILKDMEKGETRDGTDD